MRIAFVSTMATSSWGGSEALWSEAALRLVSMGEKVAASVHRWPQRPRPVARLLKAGVEVQARSFTGLRFHPKPLHSTLEPFLRNASRRAFARWLKRYRPDLICISNGGIADQLGLMQICRLTGFPYAIIVQANAEHWWPDDRSARQLIETYARARRIYFVSTRNHRLLETQLGVELSNAEVVRNPLNVSRDVSLSWPDESKLTRLACVGRLEADAKGQDLLLQVLASEPWRKRSVAVSFFGRGHCEEGLQRLALCLGLGDRVQFCGHVENVENIWATHHALVLPSRYEGLPLATVEAMMSARPVIVTDVAGNAEVVEDGVTGFLAGAPTEAQLRAAMERAWSRRHDWIRIGEAAARSIRKLVPLDPAADFARRLLELAEGKDGATASAGEMRVLPPCTN